jgi:L-alanine-DL-glutamate epimerase-like enolase superfamily enzyme
MGKIVRATRSPIATGERLVTVHEFQQIFAEKSCALAQPNLGSAGGITTVKKKSGALIKINSPVIECSSFFLWTFHPKLSIGARG